MQWHSIYVGPTTAELRQTVARRSEFYFSEDHEAVLGLFQDRVGYLLHASEVVKLFGWTRPRAIRALEEIAEAFRLPTAEVSSPHGKGMVYVWGKVIESGSWSVAVEELSYPAVNSTISVTPTATVSVPATPPAPRTPTAWDGVCDAVKTVLAGTRVEKPEAARGLIRYGMRKHDLTPGEVADMLVDLSRANRGATQAAIDERMSEASAPAEAEPEDRETPRVAGKRVALRELAGRRPDLARTCAALGVVLDVRDVPVAEAFVESWDGQFQSVAGHFTERDALDAAGAVVTRGGSKLDDVGSALAALTREAVAA